MVPSTLNPIQLLRVGNRVAEAGKGKSRNLEVFRSTDRRVDYGENGA